MTASASRWIPATRCEGIARTRASASAGLKKLAANGGRPEVYHDTITVAFLALVAERRALSGQTNWAGFIAAHQDLLDKNCLERWYDRARLRSEIARKSFILPIPHR